MLFTLSKTFNPVMKTEILQPSRVSLLQLINHSQTPLDKGVLSIIYKENANTQPAAQQSKINLQEDAVWDHTWFANYD